MIERQNKLEKKTQCLEISAKRIHLKESVLLFEEDFSSAEIDPKEWLEVGNALWTVKNGALEGEWKKGSNLQHGQIFSQQKFQGDILMEFDAQTVPPSDHDIIWWWGVKLNDERNHWKHGYLAGLGGWWTNKSGVERIDGKKVYMAMTPIFKLKPGKNYKIQCGMIAGTAFFFTNGQLIMEFLDPDPLTKKSPGRIGFGIYQSHIKFSNLKVYKPKWERVETSY